jgi:hypothetical protein
MAGLAMGRGRVNPETDHVGSNTAGDIETNQIKLSGESL